MRRKMQLLLLLPSAFLLLCFTYKPLLQAAIGSVYDYRVNAAGQFIGFSNFQRLFADPAFTASCINNVIFVVFTVVPSISLALLFAVLLKSNTRANRWLRSLFFFPSLIPLVAAAALWSFIFLPGVGLLDHYLSYFMISPQHNFLGREDTALAALIVISIWKYAGYYMLFFLAGLQSIPDDALDAAHIEGASAWQGFWHVTLPLLRPTMTFVGTVALVYAFTQIDHIPTMTNGGPGHATTVLLYYIQTITMESQDYGKAYAATVITVAALFLLTWINSALLDSGADYER
jgi:sn-glycerol 3-phosphate transport system permease protein